MSFTDLLSQLKAEYVFGLPNKISSIESYLKSQDLIALRTEFHKLKGNGKTYGLPEISELATIVEAHCLEKPESAFDSVDTALSILQKIYTDRTSEKEFPLQSDPDFQLLKQKLAS